MPAVILRYTGTNYLVGFYAADSLQHVIELIDEETDPGDFEYAIVPRGFGIEFRTGERPMDVKIGEVENPTRTLAKADRVYLTSELRFALDGLNILTWQAF